MTSRITKNRALIEALHNSCNKLSADYKSFSEDWIVKISKDNQDHFVFGYAFDVNTQASAAIASDKVACYELLANAELPVVTHYLLTTVVRPQIDISYIETLFELNSTLVLKPTNGSRGALITKVTGTDEILNILATNTHIDSWAVSPFIEIKKELRLVVFDGEVRLAYEKFDPPTVNGLKMFNLNLGASVTGLQVKNVDKAVVMLACNALKSIGLSLGAVDIVFDSNEKASVLEINSGFSLEHYAQTSDVSRAQVISFYELIIAQLFK